MKKRLHTILVAGLTFFAGSNLFAQASIPNRGCGTMEYTAMEEKLNPSVKALRAQIEQQVQDYIANQAKNPTPTPQAVIYLPVVFHVVWNTAAQNITDNCIAQTLLALNNDLRKLNTDFSTKCPAVFQGVAADCEVQFCMASKDPTGAVSNGITRTQTTQTSFSTDNKVKFTAQGGHDAWDRNKFVNLWCCNLGGGLLGYGQFPGGTANTDGVVCHSTYLVATGGCGAAPYDKGRTTVHELGHWFGLKHIWGDANCGNDGVADTPTSQTSNFGCPAFPHVTCSNGPNGDMFCNYMDYTDDPCMVMFTTGQKAVITATMNGSRAALKTSAATNCLSTGMSEHQLAEYVSVFPNPSNGDFTMNVNIPNITSADMIIYNALGEAVLEKKIAIPSGGNNVDVDMNNQPEGMYLIKMKTTEGTITKKIVINK